MPRKKGTRTVRCTTRTEESNAYHQGTTPVVTPKTNAATAEIAISTLKVRAENGRSWFSSESPHARTETNWKINGCCEIGVIGHLRTSQKEMNGWRMKDTYRISSPTSGGI
jgi:hypothetical protein